MYKRISFKRLPQEAEVPKRKIKVNAEKKTFRPRFSREELKILAEALRDYIFKMEKAFNMEHTLEAFEKQRATQKLWLNIRLLLNGEKSSGRRRIFRWSDQDLLNSGVSPEAPSSSAGSNPATPVSEGEEK